MSYSTFDTPRNLVIQALSSPSNSNLSSNMHLFHSVTTTTTPKASNASPSRTPKASRRTQISDASSSEDEWVKHTPTKKSVSRWPPVNAAKADAPACSLEEWHDSMDAFFGGAPSSKSRDQTKAKKMAPPAHPPRKGSFSSECSDTSISSSQSSGSFGNSIRNTIRKKRSQWLGKN